MKRYVGERVGMAGGGYVWVERISDGAPVERVPLFHRRRHSIAFNWGYEGSGPADLALSILWDHLGEEPTKRAYLSFKRDHVARLEDDGWHLDELVVAEWVERHRAEASFVTAAEEREFWMLDPGLVLEPVRPCCWCDEALTYVRGRGWCHPDGDQIVRRCKGCDRRCGPHEIAETECRRCGGVLVDDHVATPNHASAG